MSEIYLDNSATTALSPTVKNEICRVMEYYGNPSSLHPLGMQAHRLIEQARKEILSTLGIRYGGQLIFTSCGSEADQLALFGTAYAKPRRKGGRIISTDSEHAAVEKALQALERDGFDVVRVPTKNGVLDWEFYSHALEDARTFFVTMMAVNNETGAQYDIARAFSMAKSKNPNIVTHTDAVQGYLKCRLLPQRIMADFVSISGHKLHAPKGIGALYVSEEAIRRKDLVATLLGGGQEMGFRSGTENVIGIAALAAAAKEGYAHLEENTVTLCRLRDRAEQLLAPLPVRINRPIGERAPHILHLTLPQIRSETMLHELSKQGICVSAGSACSSHSVEKSHALAAFGLSDAEISYSLRISFSIYNTEEELFVLANALQNACAHLVRDIR